MLVPNWVIEMEQLRENELDHLLVRLMDPLLDFLMVELLLVHLMDV